MSWGGRRIWNLDELLLYKPKGFFGFFAGGNEIIDGLERAARLGSENLRDTTRTIAEADMKQKTVLIRATLAQHYIDKAAEFHEQVAQDVWTIIIKNILDMEREMRERMGTVYKSALRSFKDQEVEDEFRVERGEIETRSRRYREAIERTEDITAEMTAALSGVAEEKGKPVSVA